MATLRRELRRDLERTAVTARGVAEEGARKALDELAVSNDKPWPSMTDGQKKLRNRLRAHGRQLGDRRDERRGSQDIKRLVQECAYEHWHRMLFARFLAECDLLIEPDTGVAISLDECRELALERGTDWLVLASEFAVRMLSQIFRAGDPVLEVKLPPETRLKLEKILEELPRDVFIADDSLGWVYQFWRTAEKDLINKSEKKIGADELPAVTQLFTEDYMVLFLLHNTLGAWWAGKRLAANPELARSAESEDELHIAFGLPGVEWTYLRFVRGDDEVWRPAAGTFDGWPKTAKEITFLDPCMGSGHFLVFALPILAAFRISEEGLSREEAVYAVLRDNLFGLEIDPRCTQIAAFNLALAAWRMVGYEQLPPLQLACSGLSLGVSKSEWLRLAERAAAVAPLPPKRDLFGSEDNLFSARIKNGFEHLYDLFAKAPWIGSLLNPREMGGNIFAAGFMEIEPLLAQILSSTGDDEMAEAAVAAQGMAKAAELLGRTFALVSTNVPYLGRGKQDDTLKDYCQRNYPEAKADLATCFVERCHQLCMEGGSTALVTPQNWLFLPTYKDLRGQLLRLMQWGFVTRLGANGFQTPMWDFNVMLISLTNNLPAEGHILMGLDVSASNIPDEKSVALISEPPTFVSQQGQLANPDSVVTSELLPSHKLLGENADCCHGLKTADDGRFRRNWWEFPALSPGFTYCYEAPTGRGDISAQTLCVRFEDDSGKMEQLPSATIAGREAWGKQGILIGRMSNLPCGRYTGEVFKHTGVAVVPKQQSDFLAIWEFCFSGSLREILRQFNQALAIDNGVVAKVPFDLAHWRLIAANKYPDGLPKPHSDDPTQWVFSGHPKGSIGPLQVAVARLLGYRWPRQTGSSFPDCPGVGPDGLDPHADTDGVVCLNATKGEAPAAERLRALLADAFGSDWSAGKQANLLAQVGYAGKTLEDWLGNGFFEQHCQVFQQRPFILHIWDGRREGFNALVNYHRLDRTNLEKLTYTYLGDWIARQKAAVADGEEGSDARLASARELQRKLKLVLEGQGYPEKNLGYDIFVRWKPLEKQPSGWEPDLNDGVRLNIRPFMQAGVLRKNPKINWNKDRGTDVSSAPWYPVFKGERINDHHLTLEEKQQAKEDCDRVT